MKQGTAAPWLWALAAGTLLGSSAGAARAAEAPATLPNVVFVITDDMGWGDLASYGSAVNRTPNIDRLAAEGIRFTNFYAAAPVCTPSRAALLTGRYPRRYGLDELLRANSAKGLPASETTIAELLKKRGYATACVGKWHLGDRPEFLPTQHGFDQFVGMPYSHDIAPLILMRGEKIEETPSGPEAVKAVVDSLTRRETEEAVRFVKEARRPFFLYLAYSMPHTPLGASPEFRSRAPNVYSAAIEELDWGVGRLLSTLEEQALAPNTIVVFTSDNGAPGSEPGSSNGPLRGGKLGYFEGGIRVPCLVRWPARVKPGRVENGPAILTDWFATLAHAAGAPLPQDRDYDGRDLLALLLGEGKRADDTLWWPGAIRSGPWKLVGVPGPGGLRRMLFNLEQDPGEQNDLAATHPDIVQRLLKTRNDIAQSMSRAQRRR